MEDWISFHYAYILLKCYYYPTCYYSWFAVNLKYQWIQNKFGSKGLKLLKIHLSMCICFIFEVHNINKYTQKHCVCWITNSCDAQIVMFTCRWMFCIMQQSCTIYCQLLGMSVCTLWKEERKPPGANKQ